MGSPAIKTERLYYADCYLPTFEAHVVATRPRDGGILVYLDRSAFYPASGGQPADRGTLGDVRVLDVIEEGEAVAHIVEARPQAEVVTGVIDWMRRFGHMQQHTGQHILSAAFKETFQLKTISFHMGEEVSTIDLDSDRVSARQIELAESRANEVVFENRNVDILFRTADEARGMQLRKPAGRQGEVRVISIENFDLSACGGTHVGRTGSVGVILVRKCERMKGQTRLEFVCGRRALGCARTDLRILTETGWLLSSAREQIPELVRKQSEQVRAGIKSVEALTRRLASYRARELWIAAPERNGRRIILSVFNSDENAEAKMVAQAAGRLEGCVALVGVKGRPSLVYFAQSADGNADMGVILKKTIERSGGAGGGTRNFAQGGGLDENQLGEALSYAERLLTTP